MKKIALLGVALIATSCILTVSAQTGWVKKKLDEKVSVNFPGEPEAKGPSFKLKDKDGVSYEARVIDFSLFGVDSAMMAAEVENGDFADQVKEGILQQSPELEIAKFETGYWNKYPAFNFEGDIKSKGQKKFGTCIIIGAKMYGLNVEGPTDLATKNKESFFKSIVKE